MPIPTTITDLSATAASNSPSGSDSPIDGDNFLRAHAAFIRQMYDGITASAYPTLAGLADTTDAAKGAGLVGYDDERAYATNTVGSRLNVERTTLGAASLQAAVTAAAGKRLLVIGTHTITSAVTVLDDTEIILTPGSVVQTSTADISHFDLTNKSRVRILGPGKIKKTGTGTTAYVAGVKMDGSTDCMVFGVEFEGMQWAGVYMKNATNCQALRNYVHDTLGTVQDAAGVVVHATSIACAVESNRTKDTGWHGILVQDADAGAGIVPKGTRVLFNDIDGATAYGIACYELTADDSDTLIHGNRVRNITGVNPSGSGGAGVYVQNSGGARVTSNVIRNVCTSTSNQTLTPAGIGVLNISTSITAPLVVGNTIIDVGITSGGTPNANAILLAGVNVSSSAGGAVVNGNTIRQAALTTPSFAGVYVNAASRVEVGNNKASLGTTGGASVGIYVHANGTGINAITLDSNEITGGTGQYILTGETGGNTTSGLSISGGIGRGGSVACRGVQIDAVVGYSITGLQIDAGAEALYVNASTSGRLSGNRFETSGSTGILTAGACTGSYMDASNYWGTTESKMNNGATGFRIEWIGGTSAPAAGTWAINDKTIRGTQAVGSPKAWTCTAAGAPGTQTSEGNL